MQPNVTIARLGLSGAMAHLMAKAEVGMMEFHTSETVLQSCLIEIREYGFPGILIRKMEAEARHAFPDEVPAMKMLQERVKRLEIEGGFSPIRDAIETNTHGGSEMTIHAAMMGACMFLQQSLGMSIGRIGEIAVSEEN